VVQLIYHCLDVIQQSSLSPSSRVTEEVRFIHQLFWFGVKLEDAIESLDSIDESSCNDSIASLSTESSEQSSSSVLSSPSSIDSFEGDAFTPLRAPQKRSTKTAIISKVVTNLFQSKQQVNEGVDEDAIYHAASSFIISGFESPAKTRLTTPLPVRHDIARSMRVHEQGSTKRKLSFEGTNGSNDTSRHFEDVTVAGAVSKFIGHAIELNKGASTKVNRAGWKIVSIVAHLLQGDRETSAITSAASTNALQISRTSTINVLSRSNQTDEEHCEIILQFFRRLIVQCADQIQQEAAGVIFNLILLLLLRYDNCEDVRASKTTLMTVGIVSGHISGRISELIDLSLPSQIQYIYSSLVESFDASSAIQFMTSSASMEQEQP
jgi:hypothetical protein